MSCGNSYSIASTIRSIRSFGPTCICGGEWARCGRDLSIHLAKYMQCALLTFALICHSRCNFDLDSYTFNQNQMAELGKKEIFILFSKRFQMTREQVAKCGWIWVNLFSWANIFLLNFDRLRPVWFSNLVDNFQSNCNAQNIKSKWEGKDQKFKLSHTHTLAVGAQNIPAKSVGNSGLLIKRNYQNYFSNQVSKVI